MPDVPGCVIKSTCVRFLTKAWGCSTSAPTAICCSEAVNDFIKSCFGFFFSSARCVFIRHSPTGRYSWSALRWDRGRTNKHGRPASRICRCAPVSSRRRIWAVFHRQPEAVNLAECMSSTHICKQHINSGCQSPNRKERHNTDKYVSASGWDCRHPIEEAAVVWGGEKKQQHLLIDSDSRCVSPVPACVYSPEELVKKGNLNDSWLRCRTEAVLSPANHRPVAFHKGGCVYSCFWLW